VGIVELELRLYHSWGLTFNKPRLQETITTRLTTHHDHGPIEKLSYSKASTLQNWTPFMAGNTSVTKIRASGCRSLELMIFLKNPAAP